METITIIFKVLPAEPIKVNNTIEFIDTSTGLYQDFDNVDIINWNTNDIIQLNNKFRKLVKTNYDNFITHTKTIVGEPSIYDRIMKNDKYKLKIMHDKFLKTIDSYDDVFNRDFNAFYQEKKINDVDINVCILFDNKYNFLGYIYFWITNNMCIGFGIRSNVNNFFNKIHIKITQYLFEGLRKYAYNNNHNYICIPDPLFHMASILLNYNFTCHRIYEYSIKNKFMGYFSIISIKDYENNYLYPSSEVFLYTKISKPFILENNASLNTTIIY